MPPKKKFTKDQIIQAAFKIVEKKGLTALTARNVARQLKSSTTPVYSHFKTIKELEREVIKKAKDLLFKYSTTPYTDRKFLNMGTGYAIFARDHSQLFKALFMEKKDFKDVIDEFLSSLRTEMVKDKRFTQMPAKDRDALLTKMWIFTHGLATLICVRLIDDICKGLIKNDSDKCIIQALKAVGSAIIGAALAANRKTN